MGSPDSRTTIDPAYRRALEVLAGIRMFGWKLGLEPLRAVLGRLDNPQDALPFIHIAGTNGKGSVAAMCQAVLTAAGQRTGLYTSPHLVSFCERFQIDGRLIAERTVAQLVHRVLPVSTEVARDPRFRELTFFEFVTVMALEYFRDQRVDCVVWETGLGGRLDATNIVTPRVSVITNVGLDHMQHLGDTIDAIAREKAGIIKPGVPVVTAARRPEALAAIREVAAHHGAPLTVITEPATDPVPLIGEHQGWNCATARAALRAAGYDISDEVFRRGLAQVTWPGRFQVVSREPTIVLDGAHNEDATRTLVAALDREFAGRPVVLVLGVLRDKDYPTVCRLLAPKARRIICLPVRSERTSPPAEIAQQCRAANPAADVVVASDVAEALRLAETSPAPGDVIVVTGSLFLVGEAMNLLQLPFGVAPTSLGEMGLQ